MNLTEINDKELVLELQNGNVEAFEELLTRHEERVYNLALRITRNQEDAEEVLQDVFTSVYRKIDTFEGKAAFSSWIYRITSNTAFMLLRKRKQRPAVSIEDLPISLKNEKMEKTENINFDALSCCYNSELQDQIGKALSKIPKEYGDVFILRDIDGMSNQEVAETLQLSIAAVKSRLHRARVMLRKSLQDYYDDFTGKKMIIPVSAAC